MPGNDTSLLDTVLAADTERAELLAEAERADDPNRIAEIQTRLADIDAWSAEGRASSILKGLGFSPEKQQLPCSAFQVDGECAWPWPQYCLHNLICCYWMNDQLFGP